MKTRYSPAGRLQQVLQGITRRDFLRFTSYGLMVAAAPTLVGCGGGGGGGGPPSATGGANPGTTAVSGAGTKGDPVSASLRYETFSNVETEFARLAGGGTSFDPAAMVDYLKQQPAFYEVGYADDAGCAWAVFTDGRKLMIINNVDPSLPPVSVTAVQTRSVAARAFQLPALPPGAQQALTEAGQDPTKPLLVKEQFRLINMWENAKFWTNQNAISYEHATQGWVDADTIPKVGRMANGLGFDVIEQGVIPHLGYTVDRSRIGEVEELLSVTGDGVFFLTGSAGYFDTSEESIAAICTATLAGTVAEETYQQDIKNGTLLYAMALDHVDPGLRTYLAFTPQFTKDHHWSFPTESLVFLNVTGGGFVRWVDALSFAGAGLLFGWSDRPKQATMLGAAQDLFELLFATNHINPSIISLDIEPRLRPYGIAETRDFLSRHHIIDTLTADGTVNHLESLPGYTDPYVAQLRPAIEWIAVNEDAGDDGELLIQGQFGESAFSDSKVLIGTDTKEIKDPDTNVAIPELSLVGDLPLDDTDELPIFEWNPSFIRVNGTSDALRRNTGMIQIWQGKRFSNIAHLTRWKITFQITRTVGGIFLRSVTMDVYVRAFVSGYRLWPDQDLNVQWPMTSVISAKNGKVGWSASGSEQSTDGLTTVAWDGAGNFNTSVQGINSFRLEGLILINDKQMDCRLEMSVTDGLLIKTTSSGGTDTVPKEFSVKTPPPEVISYYPSGLPKTGSFSLQFDNAWNVIAGDVIFTDKEESTPFSSKDNCETQVMWSAAQPEFPPEMDRGGR